MLQTPPNRDWFNDLLTAITINRPVLRVNDRSNRNTACTTCGALTLGLPNRRGSSLKTTICHSCKQVGLVSIPALSDYLTEHAQVSTLSESGIPVVVDTARRAFDAIAHAHRGLINRSFYSPASHHSPAERLDRGYQAAFDITAMRVLSAHSLPDRLDRVESSVQALRVLSQAFNGDRATWLRQAADALAQWSRVHFPLPRLTQADADLVEAEMLLLALGGTYTSPDGRITLCLNPDNHRGDEWIMEVLHDPAHPADTLPAAKAEDILAAHRWVSEQRAAIARFSTIGPTRYYGVDPALVLAVALPEYARYTPTQNTQQSPVLPTQQSVQNGAVA